MSEQNKNWSVTFTNLTEEQAKTFASWYCGQGEQDASVWFDAHELKTPYVDNSKEYITKDNNISVTCR